MKKMLVVLMALVAVLCAFAVVSADQNGTKTWCNADEYGCWVTDEDDSSKKVYIQFWSVEARKYIMGDSSTELVAPKPAYVTDQMVLRVVKGWEKTLNPDENIETATSVNGTTISAGLYDRNEMACRCVDSGCTVVMCD